MSLKIKGCKDVQYFSIYKSLTVRDRGWDLSKDLNSHFGKIGSPIIFAFRFGQEA